MTPIKMIYQPSEADDQIPVMLYDITHTFDATGAVFDTIATAWNTKTNTWIVAPLWCFIPAQKKTLKEG